MPKAGACWGTSHHQTSPAALCLGAANWRVLLSLCPLLNYPSSRSSWTFLGHLHPPTRKYGNKLNTVTENVQRKHEGEEEYASIFWFTSGADCVMLGFTSSLPLSVPLICPSKDLGISDMDLLFIAFSVSSILQETFGNQTTSNRSKQRCLKWPFLTFCSTRPGCSLRQSLVYQQSPAWSSCPCERRAGALWAPPPFSAASLAHWAITTDWNRWQSSQTHRREPAFSSHWS